jgi:Amt family ammonium transporter
VLFHSFGVTWLIATVLDKTMGLRVRPEVEQEGVDVHLHAESAYDLTHPSPATEPVPAPGGVTRRVVAVAGVRARGFP